ncbi:TPA: DUF262 domain-containing protein [Staphylococcus aureus]
MGYRIETRTFEELEGKLKLPTFQRALVWSNNQKQEFFSTLKDGFPFGSILLYEYENDNKYSLIDGLQRYSTFSSFIFTIFKQKYPIISRSDLSIIKYVRMEF